MDSFSLIEMSLVIASHLSHDVTGFYPVLVFFRFYWVFIGFTGIYQVLLGFTEFQKVSKGFNRFYGVYWVLLK